MPEWYVTFVVYSNSLAVLFCFMIECIEGFDMLTVTSKIKSTTGTGGGPLLVIETSKGEVRSAKIDCSGSLCSYGTIDYFVNVDNQKLRFDQCCIRKEDIKSVKLKADSGDAWRIASIFLFARISDGSELITADPVFEKWLETDENPNHAEHQLTLYKKK